MLDKGAVTRMNNTITQGKKNQMKVGPGGEIAQQSLKKQLSPKPAPKSRPPVGNNYDEVLRTQAPLVNIPTGGPSSMPPDQSAQFNPEVFKEDVVNNLLGTIKTHQFLNSAAFQDAKTSVELKEMFNQFNPNKKPDPRSMVDRVVNRMGINPNE